MGAGNDVGCHEAVTHALAGVGASANGGVHSTGFATHQHGDVATTDELATDQGHFSRLGHGISCFDRFSQETWKLNPSAT